MIIPEHFAVPSIVDLALYSYNPFPDIKFLLHFLLLQRHTLFKAVQCHHVAIFWRFGPKNPAKRAPELVRNPGLLFQLTALSPCSACCLGTSSASRCLHQWRRSLLLLFWASGNASSLDSGMEMAYRKHRRNEGGCSHKSQNIPSR